MKNLKNLSALLLLSMLALTAGCKGQQDFYDKEGVKDINESSVDTTPSMNPPVIVPEAPVVDPVAVVPVAVDPVIPTIEDACLTDPKACDLAPVVTKAGVVTMLLAFGDLVNDRVVITEGSARMLAQNSVKYASPVTQPKILVIKDFNNHNESKYDTQYIATVLLSNYNQVKVVNETSAGLGLSDLEGYDLIWFNNPGYAMGSKRTMESLMAFKGGVILSGDDLTQGKGFSMGALTGLKFIDNGTSMNCNGRKYSYDNNGGEHYQVEISNQFLPGIPENLRMFEYGNDIDNSSVIANSKLEVLASAKGICGSSRPVIVRYEK
jgi:hypothetical protein